MTAEIKLIQNPIIQQNLVEMGKSVTERLSSLNLENQVATEDTIKTLKSMRAELNKEAREFEEQRKFVKTAVLSPYDEFEALYKSEIIEKYKSADALLKDKINAFEMNIKTTMRNNLVAYFNEICEVEGIDWLTFDRLEIDINLSTSEKKYKEQIADTIGRIKDDLSLIASDKYSAEILVEYKKTLKASQSIQAVRQRKESERLEAERIKSQRTELRRKKVIDLRFIYHDLTKTYNWVFDESIMISFQDIENLSDEDFAKKFSDVKFRVDEKKNEMEQVDKKEVLQAPQEQAIPFVQVEQQIQQPVIVEIKEIPVEEEIFNAKFVVSGTYSQIMALGEYLKLNNYNYQNID